MPGNKIETADQSIAITDPGEVNRESHLWGDRLSVNIGNFFAWCFPLLIAAIVIQVIIRRMGFNQAWLDEAQWWIYGIAMLVGFGYAITTESHVRVDIFHQNFSRERKSRIEVFAHGWMLIPFMVLMTDVLMHYAFASWRTWEGSDSPNGLHMLFLLKTALPILFVLAILASFTVLVRHLKNWKQANLWWFCIGAFPSIWFIAERIIYYIMWNILAVANPDVVARKISRLPAIEPTFWYGLAATLALMAYAYFKNNKNTQAG